MVGMEWYGGILCGIVKHWYLSFCKIGCSSEGGRVRCQSSCWWDVCFTPTLSLWCCAHFWTWWSLVAVGAFLNPFVLRSQVLIFVNLQMADFTASRNIDWWTGKGRGSLWTMLTNDQPPDRWHISTTNWLHTLWHEISRCCGVMHDATPVFSIPEYKVQGTNHTVNNVHWTPQNYEEQTERKDMPQNIAVM